MSSPLLNRREAIGKIALVSATTLTGCAGLKSSQSPGIIDAHTHFYDPTRPQGVPWPPKDDAVLYRPVLPPELKRIAVPLGVTGTMVVEASSWIEDNEWVLDLSEREPFIVGLVGHLKPGGPDFESGLARFAAHPRFRGIRTGLWNVSITPTEMRFMNDLRLLSERDLALDVLVGPDQLDLVDGIANAIPALRIVVDHCANVPVTGKTPPEKWRAGIQKLAQHKQVYMKVSGLVEGSGRINSAPTEANFYKAVLDVVWDSFGEDRVFFGSNWPVSARFADYATVLHIVRQYFESKGSQAAHKYFSAIAARAYKIALRQ